jgi:hypothetical protein
MFNNMVLLGLGNHLYAIWGDPSGGDCHLLGIQNPSKTSLAKDYYDSYSFPDYSVFLKETVTRFNPFTIEELNAADSKMSCIIMAVPCGGT